jgi:hypothetical protein
MVGTDPQRRGRIRADTEGRAQATGASNETAGGSPAALDHDDPAAGAVVQALCTRDLEGPETMRGLGKSRLQLGLPAPRGRARGSAASVRGLLTKGLPSS